MYVLEPLVAWYALPGRGGGGGLVSALRHSHFYGTTAPVVSGNRMAVAFVPGFRSTTQIDTRPPSTSGGGHRPPLPTRRHRRTTPGRGSDRQSSNDNRTTDTPRGPSPRLVDGPVCHWRPLRKPLPVQSQPSTQSYAPQSHTELSGTQPDLPLASAGSDMIRCSRVLLSHTLDAARSY